MKEETKVMYESPEAAMPAVLVSNGKVLCSGFMSTDNFFFKDEKSARYRSHTHSLCECGTEIIRGYSICNTCRVKKRNEMFNKMTYCEWDGVEPLVIFDTDTYFFSSDDIDDYLEESGDKPEDLQLVICQPNMYQTINPDYWEDVLPEDGDIPESLYQKLKELNEFIKTLPPASWSQGNIRTYYTPNKPQS